MFYKFDIYRWVVQSLPPIIRKPVIIALAYALLKPLAELYARFELFRRDTNRRLSSNAFVICLEKFLNDVLFVEGIYISDYQEDKNLYLAYPNEIADIVYLGYDREGAVNYLSSSPPDDIIGGFVINIPASIDTVEYRAQIEKWVNYYKYTGTKFIIRVYYE